MPPLRPSGSRSVIRALRSSPGAGGSSGGTGSSTNTSSGLASGEPHLDVPVTKLPVERQGGLGEQVDQPKPERRLHGVREAPQLLHDRLVAERRDDAARDRA